jgi:AcrR family transcriptional regulator
MIDAAVDTRERILMAARDVMARKGKRGATTREIADAAGVNEATLFRHFGAKEKLIVAVAKRYCGDIELRNVAATLNGPVEEDLRKIAEAFNERLESLKDMIRWSLVEIDYDESVFAQETWRPQTAMMGIISQYMQRQIDAGVLVGNPEHLASVFGGMLFARVISREKYPDNSLFTDTEYAIKFFINVFLNGVRSK